MENLDKATLIHLGAELVVVGGLTFWFQRKTSALQGEIDNLNEKLGKCHEIIQQQSQIIQQHDQILRQILGGGAPQSLPSRAPVAPRTSEPQPSRQAPPSRIRRTRTPSPSPDKDSEPMEDLDKLLEEEIDVIQKSRKSPPAQPEYIEVDYCVGDECSVVSAKNSKSQLKKSRGRRKKSGDRDIENNG